MRGEWQCADFEDCLEKVTYTSKIQRKDFLPEGKHPVVSQEEDFVNGYWNDDKDVFRIKKPVVVFGDHTKVIKYIDFDFVLGADGVKLLQPKDFLLPRFFYYQLQSVNLDSLGYARHYKLLRELSVTYPAIAEQKHIVAVLDEAFAAIAKAKESAEKNLANARALFDSYLLNVFADSGNGWKEKKLSQLCEKITDGTHQTPTYFDSGVIFLSSKNVTSGKIDWENVRYIDSKQHTEMHKRVAPKLNDILLAKNGTTGVAALVDRDVVFDIYVSLALLKPLKSILPQFLLYFVNSSIAKKQFNKRLKGVGVPNLHLEEIREVSIRVPESLVEQKRIVSELDALSTETKRLESIYRQKLLDIEELKKSILQKAFNGELVGANS